MDRRNQLVNSEVDSTAPGELVVHSLISKSARVIASNISPVGSGVGK